MLHRRVNLVGSRNSFSPVLHIALVTDIRSLKMGDFGIAKTMAWKPNKMLTVTQDPSWVIDCEFDEACTIAFAKTRIGTFLSHPLRDRGGRR